MGLTPFKFCDCSQRKGILASVGVWKKQDSLPDAPQWGEPSLAASRKHCHDSGMWLFCPTSYHHLNLVVEEAFFRKLGKDLGALNEFINT